MFTFKNDRIDFAHKIDEVSKPSEEYEKHLHIFYEIFFFLKGDVTYTIESETHKLQKGDIVIIPPGKHHFAYVNSEVRYERYVLKFDSDLIPIYLKEKINKQSPFFSDTSSFSYHFQNLDRYFNKYKDEDLETLFLTELVQILVKLLYNPTHDSIKRNEFISNLIEYIDENIQSKMTLDTLANQFNFSKSYISSEFKKYMQTPVIHYIKTKKIIAAHQMILQGVSKTKVAELFGFDDYSTFYRSYIKVMKNN